ncbi:MAG: SurA N-terminal domain-containing protein [Hyphomicrobiaceae bacterium]
MKHVSRFFFFAAASPVLLAGPVTAQETPMKFPSFNSINAQPQGVAPGEAVVAPPKAPAAAAAAADSKAAGAAPKAAVAAKPKPKPVKMAVKSDAAAVKSSETKGLSIAVLVNDEPITGYEIEQRQRIMGLGANIGERAQAGFKRMLQDPSTGEKLKAILGDVIKANPGKSREQVIAAFEERKKQFAMNLQKQAVESARASVLPTLKKGALDELIEERLKLQEAKKLNVVASDEDVSKIVRSLAEKNKLTEAQFGQHLAGMGADIDGMRARFRAMLSWNDVIRRKFGHQIAITERDVDRIVSQGPAGEDQVELQVQRVTLAIPEKINQKLVAQRMAEAEGMRSKFRDCKSMSSLAGSVTNAKFDDLGQRKPSSLAEPTKSLLLSAKDGEMIPPTVGTGGVELYAVCGRQTIKADEQKRTAAQEELRQKEFELLAKRHLQNLRQDALIEYR